MNDSRVVRIEIEYADGRVFRQIGEKADQIVNAWDGALSLQQVRTGMHYKGPKLEEVTSASGPSRRSGNEESGT